MEFLKKLSATLATKYGTVIEGKHEGSVVALGDDPSKKVQISVVPKQIVFFEGTEEKGRYDINESIKAIKILEETKNGLKVYALFNNGEHFTMELKSAKEDNLGQVAFNALLGKRKANATKQEEAERVYKPIKDFMDSFIVKLTVDSAEFLLNLYQKNDVLDDLHRNLLERVIAAHNSK